MEDCRYFVYFLTRLLMKSSYFKDHSSEQKLQETSAFMNIYRRIRVKKYEHMESRFVQIQEHLGITDMLEYSSWKMITSHCNNCNDMHNNDGKCDYDNIEYELCYYQ